MRETESDCPPVLAKRLWSILRIVYYMLRKGVSKQKWMMDLHLMMKRGKRAGKKAIDDLVFHHHPAFICQSEDAAAFIAPREYEFSCSNSPAYPSFIFHASKRKSHRHRDHRRYEYASSQCSDYTTPGPALAPAAAASAFESDVSAAMSPMPGFGKDGPLPVRQLRITDSPFPIKDAGDEDGRVDREAEEFIREFYEQLRLQKRMAAYEARWYREMTMAGSRRGRQMGAGEIIMAGSRFESDWCGGGGDHIDRLSISVTVGVVNLAEDFVYFAGFEV
ncbi:hypothetical protein ACLOJK_040145 [Asimina triloba]